MLCYFHIWSLACSLYRQELDGWTISFRLATFSGQADHKKLAYAPLKQSYVHLQPLIYTMWLSMNSSKSHSSYTDYFI